MQGIRYYAYTREMGAASEWQLMADSVEKLLFRSYSKITGP